MARLFKWLLRAVVGLLVLGAAVLILGYYFFARSLPDYDADAVVRGIDGPVEIVRDTSAVPHVFAGSDADAMFGLGYAHAQDRLWQMTMLRRTAQGRLSELFGTETVPIDELMRRLDLYRLSVSSVAAQDAETTAALRAYSAGVNAWIGQVNEGAMGRGAPEMWLFNHAIAPWAPADSIAVLKLMALQLSSHLEAEVLRARVSLVLDDTRADDLLIEAPGGGIAALPRYSALVPGVQPGIVTAGMPAWLNPVQPAALSGASNAWAAGISRSATGSTLLANDPHLGLTAPTIWYLARLELSSGGVIGGTIPGVPAVLVGRSGALGWGLTTAYLDDQDVYIEEVNPADASQYRGLAGWEPFATRASIISVRDAPAVTLQLQWTANGPVLPPTLYDLGAVRPPGHVTSVAWTALSGADTSISAAMGVMRAQTVRQALRAAEDYVAPAQMLTLADRTGIGMALIGAMPERDAAHASEGRLPTFGWEARNRWRGTLPYADNPRWVAPAGGIVGNTNNKILDRPFPDHVSHRWGDTQRIFRWRRLMQAREVHTRESFREAQLDTVSFTARSLLPLMGAELWFTGEASEPGTPDRRREVALELLAAWNGEMNEHLPEPLIFMAWARALQDRLIRDELGPLAAEFTHIEPLFIERVFRDVDGAARWCDVIQSAPTESCADIARLALDDALVWLEETSGGTVDSLRWGDAHEATHDHPVLGEVPVLRWLVNIRQSTSGGDFTLQRGRTAGTGDHPFHNVHSGAYRGIYDFADPDSSVFVTSTGQSGHPLSRHYDDLSDLWRRGEYIPMSLDPALARAGSVGTTVLTPAER
ncbi:MAG: penicillin acylase family protein [Paracoccaceae bacterium]